MLLSIVIPSLLEPPTIEYLIRSCEDQLGEIEFEIVVVHPSSAANIALPSSSINIRRVSIPEKNVSLARNRGLSESRGKYILFLDDDVILPKNDFLIRLFNNFQSLPENSILGGGYLDSPSASCIQRVGNSLANMWIQSGLEMPGPIPPSICTCQFLVGGVLFSQRSSFQKTPFPESISWGGEDTAFLYSAKENKVSFFYCKECDVVHDGGSSFIKFLRRSWLSGKIQNLVPYQSAPLTRRIGVLRQNLRIKSLPLLPLMGLHFLILKLSKVFYKIQ